MLLLYIFNNVYELNKTFELSVNPVKLEKNGTVPNGTSMEKIQANIGIIAYVILYYLTYIKTYICELCVYIYKYCIF